MNGMKDKARAKTQHLIPTEPFLLRKYAELSTLELWLYYLVSINNNLSVFISGIISSVPITLLLNLVTTDLSEIELPLMYMILYVLVMIASVMLCWMAFRITLNHIKVEERYKKQMDSDSVEERNHELIRSFCPIAHTMRRDAIYFIISALITIAGILEIFLLVNL